MKRLRKVSLSLKIGITLVLLLAVPMTWGWCQSSPGIKSVVEPIHFGAEKPGVNLEVVILKGDDSIEPMAIRVRQSMSGLPHTTFLLSSFSQLRGLVQIQSTQAALRFVRLKTDYCDEWPLTDQDHELEVTVASPAQLKQSPSGYYGALSPSAYRQGGFTPKPPPEAIESRAGSVFSKGWLVREYSSGRKSSGRTVPIGALF